MPLIFSKPKVVWQVAYVSPGRLQDIAKYFDTLFFFLPDAFILPSIRLNDTPTTRLPRLSAAQICLSFECHWNSYLLATFNVLSVNKWLLNRVDKQIIYLPPFSRAIDTNIQLTQIIMWYFTGYVNSLMFKYKLRILSLTFKISIQFVNIYLK